MKCDAGRLQAYLDAALSAEEHRAVTEHLACCEACRGQLAVLRRQGLELSERLGALDPQPGQDARAPEALERFWTRVWPQRSAGPAPARAPLAVRWRWAAVGLATLVLVATLLSFAPIRHAAAEFLGIFRVRRFAVIPVDPVRVEQLAGVEDLVTELLGEPIVLREAGPAVTVSDAAEATALAGFQVRAPMVLPEGATLQPFRVEPGPAVRFEVERAGLELLLQAAGVQQISLPDVETIVVTTDLATVVEQECRVGSAYLSVIQTPSPEVTMSPDMDLAALGEAMLQFLGVPEADARRLAQQIDWGSTLVIPLPTNVAEFREVEVDGVTALLLDEVSSGQGSQSWVHRALLWQRGGVVYALVGENASIELLLQVADSLR